MIAVRAEQLYYKTAHSSNISKIHNNSTIDLCNMTNHANRNQQQNVIVQTAQRTIGLQRTGGARMWERERRGTIGGGVGEGAYSTREYKGTVCREIQYRSVYSGQHTRERIEQLEYIYIIILTVQLERTIRLVRLEGYQVSTQACDSTLYTTVPLSCTAP